MSTVSTALMTAEEFYDWCHRPENRDRLFELERGKVVEMSRPGEKHGVVCINVSYLFGSYLRQRGRGRACANDTGLILERGPDTVRGPDIFLYDKGRPFDQLEEKYSEEMPQLVAEVLSPTDRMSKMTRRITHFLRRGVAVVWLIDPEDRTVTVYRPDELPQVLEENDDLTGTPPFPDLRCRVADLFFTPAE